MLPRTMPRTGSFVKGEADRFGTGNLAC